MNSLNFEGIYKDSLNKQYTYKTKNNCYIHICKNYKENIWESKIYYSHLTKQYNLKKWCDSIKSTNLHTCIKFIRNCINHINTTIKVYDDPNQLNLFDFIEN